MHEQGNTFRPLKFLICLFKGHDWSGGASHYNVCWRCKHVKESNRVEGQGMVARIEGAECPDCGYRYYGSDFRKLFNPIKAYACNGCGVSNAFKRITKT